jgi:LysR family glycine cleavage system transcriptional activator
MLSLKQLNTFYFAARAQSFQQAAVDLHVSASAVSHQIKHLEARLDTPLFIRKDKRVELSQMGQQLFDKIKEPLETLHKITPAQFRSPMDNTLTLSIAPVFAASVVFPRLNDFYARFPEYSLNVLASTERVGLANGDFDAAIRLSHREQLAEDEYIAPLSLSIVAASRLANRFQDKLNSCASIATLPRIDNQALPNLWQEWADAHNVTLTNSSVLSVQSMSQVVETMQYTDAIGLIDTRYAQPFVERGEIITAQPSWTSQWAYGLLLSEQARGKALLDDFSAWLTQQLAHCSPIKAP